MKLDEAIKNLDDLLAFWENKAPPKCQDAVKLGIEALKHFQYHRDHNIISFVKLLPGETEGGHK